MRFRSVVLDVMALAVAACHSAGDPAKAPTVDTILVRVAPILRDSLAPPVIATGTLGPKDEIALSFKIGGVVSTVRVDPGATVRAGELLASLDRSEIDAAVTRAQSAADKADRDLARAKRLYTDSVVTLAQFQDAGTAADVAHADLTTASFNRRYAVIVAPTAGIILTRQAEPGELVSAGKTILLLGSRARGSVVRVGLADRDVVRITRGDPATVRFDALPGKDLVAAVTEIASTAESATGTYTVEVALTVPAAASATLASGLVGRVEIRPRVRGLSTLIPVEALLEADGNRGIVYVLQPNLTSAERRVVTVGSIAGDRVAVLSGLEGASRVITEGAAYLKNGTAVKVVP